MVTVHIGVFADEPDENFNVFFAPIFLDSFVLNHSEIKIEVLLDSNVHYLGDHVGTDVKIAIFLVFYVRLAMSNYILS